MFTILCLITILKLVSSQGQALTKCADFKSVDEPDVEKSTIGRWNLVRLYGMPTIPDEKKWDCCCVIGSHADEEKKFWLIVLITKRNGDYQNYTSLATMEKNAVLEVTTQREFDVMGSKIKVNIHVVHTLLLLEGDYGLVASCHDNPMKKGEYFQVAGILSRKTTLPSSDFIEKSEETLRSYGIATTFTEINHEECQY